jgi:deoxyribose-phosphate aldolase
MPNIIKTSAMPSFWWLNPWRTAVELHKAVAAFKTYADRVDMLVDIQSRVIDDQSAEIRNLRERVAQLHDAITAGGAIVPDAQEVRS